MTTLSHRRHHHVTETPDAHDFPTREYDLVKEFVIALVVMTALTLLCAAVFSSPDEKAVTLQRWAQAAPNDVVATATAELAGTSTSASYGPPYNNASTGQKLGPLSLQKWAGIRVPLDSANEFVITPVRTLSGDPAIAAALQQWDSAGTQQRQDWAASYSDALAAAPDGNPAAVKPGDFGPVPVLARAELTLAASGSLEGLLTTRTTFYGDDSTRALLLFADGAYLEDQARAQHLGGDQWGMMNETGNYPGQPWLWLYTFWYQVKPFSTSENADALVWGLMVLLSAGLLFVPWIPGVRSLPKHLGVHRLIWRRG
jgi:hypothetical protein